ncbi:hypothetical protein A2U01_0035600 [Trifolium medium]|uniref:Uncharacterized protein n=1 Tax=Trifolium medium TaxID=97028 RepID=A0A392PSJ5_9FABA|nr:hypothetical protein [Trifolium medium]
MSTNNNRNMMTISNRGEIWRRHACELDEAWDQVCLVVDGEHQLLDIDTVEWPMIAMDIPTVAAVWDKREWSTEAADK